MTLWQRIKAVFRPPTDDGIPYGGRIIAPPDMLTMDGVDYSQPVIFPQYIAETMSHSAQHAYITEASKAFRFQFDTPYEGDQPVSPVTDDPLYEWTYTTRQRVLTNCHAAYQRNPLAKAIVDYSNGFVIGDGFNLTCMNQEVEDFLNEFMSDPDNDIRAYEKCVLTDLQVDGEIMLEKHEAEGREVLAPRRPRGCQKITTEAGFFRRKVAYEFQRPERTDDQGGSENTNSEPIPAENVLHIAINRHGYELRGRPDLFVILPWLRAYNDWLQNRARVNHYANAFVWHDQVETQNPGTIAAVANRFKEPPKPGSVYVSSSKETLSAINAQVRAGDAAEDGRQIRMMANTGARMPEYMLGDGENANLATATAQQMPALTKFQDYQQILVEQLWKPMLKQALQAAVDAGVLPEEVEEQDSTGVAVYEEPDPKDMPVPELPTLDNKGRPVAATEASNGQEPPEEDDAQPELPKPMPQQELRGPKVMVKTVDAFAVAYEPIGKDDPNTLAAALQTFFQNEAISLQTMQEEGGFDPAVEEKRKAKEKQQSISEMAQGLKPIPPGMFGKPTVAEQIAGKENETEEEPA